MRAYHVLNLLMQGTPNNEVGGPHKW